mgnify:CR=1 FL=1
MTNTNDLVAQIEDLATKLGQARSSIARRFLGQDRVVDLTLTALVCGGHAVLIGLPGLGKTRLVDTLSTVMGLDGNRIQFTPDLMPADILGSEILDVDNDGNKSELINDVGRVIELGLEDANGTPLQISYTVGFFDTELSVANYFVSQTFPVLVESDVNKLQTNASTTYINT